MVKLTFLGHACFVIDDGTAKLIVDPFLTGNPAAAATPEEIEADYVFVTHGHSDHLGDAVQIAERTGAVVCTSVDLAEAVFNGKGLKVEAGNMGGWIRFPFGRAKFFQAIHGSGAPGTLSRGRYRAYDGYEASGGGAYRCRPSSDRRLLYYGTGRRTPCGRNDSGRPDPSDAL